MVRKKGGSRTIGVKEEERRNEDSAMIPLIVN
jgi:hypothetical protein